MPGSGSHLQQLSTCLDRWVTLWHFYYTRWIWDKDFRINFRCWKTPSYNPDKAPVPRKNGAVAFMERWPFKKRWPLLRKRRIGSVTAYGPSYRFKSFELHKILRAVRKGQFSAPAKFTAAIFNNAKSKFDTARRKFVLRADTELLERCQALRQRSIGVMNFS